MNPKDQRAYYSRAVSHSKKGDLDLAIADYTRAIELKLDQSVAASGAYSYGGDLAPTAPGPSAQFNPLHMAAYLARGVAKGKKGNIDGAISDYEGRSRSIQGIRLRTSIVQARIGPSKILRAHWMIATARWPSGQGPQLVSVPQLHLSGDGGSAARRYGMRSRDRACPEAASPIVHVRWHTCRPARLGRLSPTSIGQGSLIPGSPCHDLARDRGSARQCAEYAVGGDRQAGHDQMACSGDPVVVGNDDG